MRKFILGIYIVLGVLIGLVLLSFLVQNQRDKSNINVREEGNANSIISTKATRKENSNDITNVENKDVEVEELFITRAMATKLLCLSKERKSTILTVERELEYSDTSEEIWYDKYLNIAVIEGWISGENHTIRPNDLLTFDEFMKMMAYFRFSPEEITNKYSSSDPISRNDFQLLLGHVVDENIEDKGVYFEEVYVFMDPSGDDRLEDYELVTDRGKYTGEGISFENYIDKKIEVLVRDREIMEIISVVDEEPILKYAYVTNSSDGEMDVFVGGINRSIPVAEGIKGNNDKYIINDIQIVDGEIVSISPITEIQKGIVKKIDVDLLELDNNIVLSVDEELKVYTSYNELAFGNVSKVLVGYDTSNFYINEEGKVAAIEVTTRPEIENIRVVLKTTDYKNHYHDYVVLTCSENYSYIRGEQALSVTKDENIDLQSLELKEGERILFSSDKGRIKVKSIKRGWGKGRFNPEYRGTIEVQKVNGKFLVINEVEFEAYLYSVVPSEMPTSHGLEALKVQAICARSYAYSQFYSNGYAGFGAHVDDSTSCQVYNNTKENSTSIQAVNDTKGQVLSYNGNVISTNFFSTSCGITSNVGDVWANYRTKEFPTTTVEYLQAKFQSEDSSSIKNLKDEKVFKSFIDNKNMDTYDSNFNWFRWDVEMSKEELEKTIEASIAQRYETVPRLIQSKQEDGTYKSRTIEKFGELIDIEIIERGESGIITKLLIESTGGSYLVSTEYNVRKLLAPINYTGQGDKVVIIRNDGSKVSSMSLMPSAYFYMEKKYNTDHSLAGIIFRGGGYGHGVGMSQNGVKTMVNRGYNYKEVLNHYYEGTKVIEK